MHEPQGWVKVHRKTLENPLLKNPKLFTLWMYLLLRANHTDAKAMIGNKVIGLKRGQFLTGRKVLSEALDIPETTLERLLGVLESEQQIGQQKLTKYRLISILNYDLYQGDGQQTDNKRTTNGQQTDTDKNVKNNKNEKKEGKASAIPYSAIAESYNNYFATPTGNPQVRANELSQKRKAAIKKLWMLSDESKSEKWFINYFTHCSEAPNMQSTAERSKGWENWSPNFDFIIRQDTLDKAREGRL